MSTPPDNAQRTQRSSVQRRAGPVAILVLVLAVVWVLFSVFGDPKAPLPTRWVGFEPAADGTSVVGVITLTNRSAITFSLEFSGTGRLSTAQFFGLSWPINMDVWRPQPSPPHRRFVDLPPGVGERITVALPQDGRTGRVAIWVGTRPRRMNKLETWVRSLLPKPSKVASTEFFQLLEEYIQCPLTRPDGTVEPGRILTHGAGQQPLIIEPGVGLSGRLEIGMTLAEIKRRNKDAAVTTRWLSSVRWWQKFARQPTYYRGEIPSLGATFLTHSNGPVASIILTTNTTQALSLRFGSNLVPFGAAHLMTREKVIEVLGEPYTSSQKPTTKWRLYYWHGINFDLTNDIVDEIQITAKPPPEILTNLYQLTNRLQSPTNWRVR